MRRAADASLEAGDVLGMGGFRVGVRGRVPRGDTRPDQEFCLAANETKIFHMKSDNIILSAAFIMSRAQPHEGPITYRVFRKRLVFPAGCIFSALPKHWDDAVGSTDTTALSLKDAVLNIDPHPADAPRFLSPHHDHGDHSARVWHHARAATDAQPDLPD